MCLLFLQPNNFLLCRLGSVSSPHSFDFYTFGILCMGIGWRLYCALTPGTLALEVFTLIDPRLTCFHISDYVILYLG